jgi:hypothetical protein
MMNSKQALVVEIQSALRDYAHSNVVFAAAEPRAFPGVNLAYYRKAQRELEGLGFRSLGDYTISLEHQSYPSSTFAREFAFAEFGVMAAFFHLPGVGKVLDFETEFEDGTFHATTTAPRAKMLVPPISISRIHLKRTIPTQLALAIHLALVVGASRQRNTAVRKHRNVEDVHAAQNRQHRLKGAELRVTRRLPKEQLDHLLGGMRAVVLTEDENALLGEWKSPV